MERMFACIEETVNKSAINQFIMFLKQHSDVTKWFMCSDYCIADKNKSNDVVTFVLYPYIFDFGDWNKIINCFQKTDLKHCRHVSKSFCDFTKSGYFFSFSFILEKDNILYKWKDKTSLDVLLQMYIEMTENWQITTPNNAESYKEMNKRLKKLQNETKQKSFNYKLFGRVVAISFLAGYLRYLLLKEKSNVQIFSWLSDRDAITNWKNEIYLVFFHIISHCICENNLSQERETKVQDLYLADIKNNQFYDGVNRVADFICGALADFNYIDESVTGKKQCILLEDAISDNDCLIILNITYHGVARIVHERRDKMTQREFKARATELIKLMIDTIADKEYIKLVSSIPPKPSWASFNDAEPTPENDCLGFGKWLDEQLAMWEKDEDKKFVVDHFNESCIDDIELEDDNTSFVSYRPTSFGEELDFWFEIDFEVKDEQIIAIFDVNL